MQNVYSPANCTYWSQLDERNLTICHIRHNCVAGDVRQAFGQEPGSSASSVRSLRNDLLVAADSVTNAMSSLVKELNSG